MPELQNSITLKFVIGFLAGPPIWVWPLFFVLLFIGIACSKERTTRKVTYYFLPLLVLLALNNISQLTQPILAWSSFMMSYLIGSVVAYHIQKRWILHTDQKYVRLAGEWFTLTIMMTIFWANFVKGTMLTLAPDMYQSVLFTTAFAAALGLSSGSFLGRSIQILRFK